MKEGGKMQVGKIEEETQLRTISEAMSMLRVGRWKLMQLHKQGAIEIVKFGHRSLRVTQRSISRLLEEYRKQEK